MKHIVLTEIRINLKCSFSQNKDVTYVIDCSYKCTQIKLTVIVSDVIRYYYKAVVSAIYNKNAIYMRSMELKCNSFSARKFIEFPGITLIS